MDYLWSDGRRTESVARFLTLGGQEVAEEVGYGPPRVIRSSEVKRIAEFLAGVTAQSFTAGREAEEFRSMREERYHALACRGLIAFTDGSATHWRYRCWGALKLVALNYSIGMLRGVTNGRIPRSA